jgi:hypothetical protein
VANDDLVQTYLGAKAKAATFTIGKRAISGHRAPTKLDTDDVVPLAREAAKRGLAVFKTITDKHELFAIPGVSPTEIVELAKVGTHNGGAAWRQVQATVAKVHDRAPFDVVHADAAGLIGVFRDKLTPAKAKAIANLLESELPTALEAMMEEDADDELADDEADEDVSIEEEDARHGFSAYVARYLRNSGRFHLWWD